MIDIIKVREDENPELATALDFLLDLEEPTDHYAFGDMVLRVYSGRTYIEGFTSPSDTEEAFIHGFDHLRVVTVLADHELIESHYRGYVQAREARVLSQLGFTAARTILKRDTVLRETIPSGSYEIRSDHETVKQLLLDALLPNDSERNE